MSHRVKLLFPESTSFPSATNKVDLIKAIRTVLECGLKPAVEYINSAAVVVTDVYTDFNHPLVKKDVATLLRGGVQVFVDGKELTLSAEDGQPLMQQSPVSVRSHLISAAKKAIDDNDIGAAIRFLETVKSSC